MNRIAAAVVVTLLATPAFAYRQSAWIPTWDAAALESMQRNAGELDETNPSWYSIAADGGVSKNWNAESPELRAALSGTRIVPTIKNYINGRFDADALSKILGTADAREQHAEAIAQLVVTRSYDGIDIDYESMRASEKENFTLFIETLASKLHASRRTLSVTVHAKTSDSATWDGPGAQDWRRIGAAADSVKIMAYDKHWSTSPAGAIAPLDWIANIAKYAVSTMPASKVVMALPWYGYDWGTSGGKAVTWTEASQRVLANGARVTRDENGEATFSYGDHVVYFQDAESYRRKVDYLVARYPKIGGFAHWRVGGEDPATWDVIASMRSTGSGSTPVTKPAGTFLIDAPRSIDVRAGDRVSAPLSIVPIDGFASTVFVSLERLDAFDGVMTLNSTDLQVGRQAKLTIVPSASSRAGTYRLRVTMRSSTTTLQQVIAVNVVAADRRRAVRR